MKASHAFAAFFLVEKPKVLTRKEMEEMFSLLRNLAFCLDISSPLGVRCLMTLAVKRKDTAC